MSQSTNSLVAGLRRLAFPTGSLAALVAGGVLLVHHPAVHAAPSLDDERVSSLVSLDEAVEAVAARVTPAVVNVTVASRGHEQEEDESQGMEGIPPEFRRFFGPQGHMQGNQQPRQIEHGVGSGFIISPDGYIVTNNHVVDGAVDIKVRMNDRREFSARLVGVDKLNDLAVIKVNAKDLPSVNWGDSGNLHPGQTVLAFGSPFGSLQFSVTRGIVSALNRPNPYGDDPRKPGDYIQTDAAINPGNSGGPLVNAHGQIVGINTFIISGSGSFAGAGFAIPSEIARASADAIIKTGSVHHGYLGLSMNDVTPENASFFNLPDATGAIVSEVAPGSPASHAGLKNGDVLRQLNGRPIANGSALQVAVSKTAPGSSVELGILRDGKPMTMQIAVGEFHKDAEVAENEGQGADQHGKLGLSVNDLSPEMRSQLSVPDQIRGAAVESVRPASPAEDAQLAPGDIIVEVNRHPVESADKFVSAIHSVPAGKNILLLVWSHGGTSYRVVHPQQDQAGL